MRTLIVYAHPEPTSFNGAMLDVAIRTLGPMGHEIVVSDLYADGPRALSGRADFEGAADSERFSYPVEQARAVEEGAFSPDLAREQDRLFWAELVIFQFPLWWFGPPAILKAWIDRVLAFGLLYDLSHRFDRGRLLGRRAMLSVTTGGTTARFSDDGLYGDVERVLYPLHRGVLQYLGLGVLEPYVAYAASRSDEAGRVALLDAYAERLRGLADEPTRPLPDAGPPIKR